MDCRGRGCPGERPRGARRLPLLLLLCLVSALGASCGYRLVGHGAPSRALWIAPVADAGDVPLFGATLAAELNRQAVDRGDVSVARRRGADVHLTVRLDRVWEAGVAFVVGDLVREYLLTAEVTATLSSPAGEVLWRGSGIRADREFPAGLSINETQTNKERAQALLAGDLAREVLRRASLVLGAGS
ncbi:MAG: LPS assembly lipoprotein LptE [Deferrisomatales bacterium]